jgi:phosphate transport system substrate-binding protein
MKVSHRKSGLVLIALAIVVFSAIFVCGCTGNSNGDAPPKTAGTQTIETLTVTGSTTVLPIAQAAAEAYMEINKYADIQVSGGGSGNGVQAVGTGTADIGMASRDLKSSEAEKYPNLVQHVIAGDGIALVIYKDNPVDSLTLAQIKSIYKGEITNWNQVGGEDLEIVVVGRDSSSGTREFFYESVMDEEDFVATQLEKNSNGAVSQTVAQTPGAIGYLSMGYLDNTLKALDINVDGTLIEPTVENVLSGKYPVARNLNMFTQGEASGLAADYIAFLVSADGQKIVSDEGYVPVA